MAREQELKFGCKDINRIVREVWDMGEKIGIKMSELLNKIIEVEKIVDYIEDIINDKVFDDKAKVEIISRNIESVKYFIRVTKERYWEAVEALVDVQEFWPNEKEKCWGQFLNQGE